MQEPNVNVYKFYHEVHEGHEAKNLKYFVFIFVPLRVLCGEWQHSS